MNRLVYFIIIYFFELGLSSCYQVYPTLTKDNFYNFSQLDYDVIRLPLIYPFQLESAYSKEELHTGNEISELIHLSMNVDSVNVQMNYICMRGKIAMHSEEYSIVNTEDSSFTLFTNYFLFNSKCHELEITSKLYSSSYCYSIWSGQGILPWVNNGAMK